MSKSYAGLSMILCWCEWPEQPSRSGHEFAFLRLVCVPMYLQDVFLSIGSM